MNKVIEVYVDYSRLVPNLVKGACLDNVGEDISEQNFPSVGGVCGNVKIELAPYEKGFRPKGGGYPNLTVQLALSGQHPNLQREYDIIAFGSSYVDPDMQNAEIYPILTGSHSKRGIYTTNLDFEDAKERDEGNMLYYLIFHEPEGGSDD